MGTHYNKSASGINSLVDHLRLNPSFSDQIQHYRYLPAVKPSWSSPCFLSDPLLSALKKNGIDKLYSHQAKALKLLNKGLNTGIITPTASGKTLIYNLAVTESLISDPKSHALYLFPLKALAQDQLKILQEWFKNPGLENLNAAIYDGDTPASRRARIRRNPPRVLISNPDMLHYGFLAFPEAWMEFFKKIRYIIIDEAHTYRGIFGSHMALILRRLLRLCGSPGPRFIASSATMANAGEFLERLTGLPFSIVEESGAPREGRHIFLIEPHSSPYTEAAGFLREFIRHNIKTILFTKSRKITELISLWVQEALPEFGDRIASYRSGYLPEERRLIEKRLFSDELQAVISTSALESGIDVGGLDACILAGYPGTIISLWQRLGRAGRKNREALLAMIALPDALDHYYLRHPDKLFQTRFENCVLDPENSQVLDKHLPCAAAEKALTDEDFSMFGPKARESVNRITQQGLLRESAESNTWFSTRKQPHRHVDIRTSDKAYVIKTENTGTILGSIDSSRVFKECHPGAVYLHSGQTFEITNIDNETRTVLAVESNADWYTQYTSSKEIELLDKQEGHILRTSRENFTSAFTRVRVTERIVSYERHLVRDRSLISEHKLNLPPRVFETYSILLTVPDKWRRKCIEMALDFSGGLHAVEHILIAALPTQVLSERWDLDGLSTLAHPQIDQPCIFIYDGYPGGVGLAEKGLEVLSSWIEAAYGMVQGCECEDGCPLCIHSPKCGSRNKPLDKTACKMILSAMTHEKTRHLKIKTLENSEIKYPDNKIIRTNSSELPTGEDIRTGTAKTINYKGKLHTTGNFRILAFDLETRKSADEVGGWHNAQLMRVSVAVVYDVTAENFRYYREDDMPQLIQNLLAADMVVGFNIDAFDLKVLSGYSEFTGRIRTFDILSDIKQKLGYRLSLDHLARHTLGRSKTADGLKAIEWFREQNWTDLEAYCLADVEITYDLFNFGLRYGYILYENRGNILKLPVDWSRLILQAS